MSIQNKALLADLSISIWTNRLRDKEETAATIERHGAVAKAASVTKSLIDDSALKPIRSAAREAYQEFTTLTLPWTDRGPRILPTAIFTETQNTLIKHRDAFEREVSTFLGNLPTLLADAPNRLGTLYRPEDMPPAEKIRSSFAFDWDFSPIPDGRDFRVDLSEHERAQLTAEFEQRFPAKLTRANRDLWERAYTTISHLADRLTKYKPAEGDAKAEHPFRESTITHVRELAELLPKLNVLDDPALNQLALDMQAKLCQEDAETLRENKFVRTQVTEDALRLIDLMKGAFS